ncbi:MAG TPA: RNA polymerase sigma factor [Candidatus Scybalomonas excrementigallinarum]|nr:RNA polymerase sigma factor [Candidatus Scybalomonas excrementigallinarum]
MNTEEQQYQRFLEGDKKAFEYLVLQYKDHLIYFINRYVMNIHTAEDIAQDVFVDIYIKKERYHFRYRFKTYLYTIARNKAVDYIRKQGRQIPMVDMERLHEEQMEEESLLEQLIWKEERQQLLDAIKTLNSNYQALIILIDLEELSYQEAGKVLHKTVPQIKVSLHRARKALKERLYER